MLNFGGQPWKASVEQLLPPFLERLVQLLVAEGVFSAETAPNHVLINEYTGGQGLIPHTDGPLYFPRVAVLTLEGSALLEFYPTGVTLDAEEGIGEHASLGVAVAGVVAVPVAVSRVRLLVGGPGASLTAGGAAAPLRGSALGATSRSWLAFAASRVPLLSTQASIDTAACVR